MGMHLADGLSKCECFTNAKTPIVFNHCIEGVPISQVAHTKCLDIYNDLISWKEHACPPYYQQGQTLNNFYIVTYGNILQN